jgi:hypothetical protein
MFLSSLNIVIPEMEFRLDVLCFGTKLMKCWLAHSFFTCPFQAASYESFKPIFLSFEKN